MKVVRLVLWILALLIAIPAFSAQKTDDLVSQSYDLSQSLGGTEQVYYMTELTRVAAQTKMSPEVQEKLCLALFRIASGVPDVQPRIAGQKNSLTQLSYTNPALAMQLLSSVDIQKPDGAMLSEDLRSDAANVIFVNFIEKVKPKGLSTIYSETKYISGTGQYPYRAMANVIERLPASMRAEINTIVTDALEAYSREAGFRNRDEEFLVLLQELNRLNKSELNSDLMARVVDTFVKRLTIEPIKIKADYYGEVHVSDDVVVSFIDRNQAFLFQAFPAIRHFDPDLAARLLKADPRLAQATEPMTYVSGGFVMGSPTSDEAVRKHTQMLQESLLEQINDQRDCDPKSAEQLAQRLTNASARVVGFSSTIPSMAKANLAEARRVYNTQLTELSNLPAGEDLRARIALAQAAYSVGDQERYSSFSLAALQAGIALFDENPGGGQRAQRHDGFDELHELTRFVAGHSNVLALPIKRLQDSWLKAYLLLYEAEGQKKTDVSRGQCSD